MKTLSSLALATLFLVGAAASADDRDAVGQAQASARKWLALTDGGNYAQSWDDAASTFKGAVTKSDWEKTVKGVRAPLGALKSRKVKSAAFTRTLPGAPDGEYVVIRFESQFENKAAAIETVTPMLDKDRRWRVSGYFIK